MWENVVCSRRDDDPTGQRLATTTIASRGFEVLDGEGSVGVLQRDLELGVKFTRGRDVSKVSTRHPGLLCGYRLKVGKDINLNSSKETLS